MASHRQSSVTADYAVVEEAIDGLLEKPRLSSVQIAVLALVAFAIVLEGFDIQLAGIAAPLMLAEWHIAKSWFGIAVAAALLGMAIGAPAGGLIGDRYGRRPVLIAGLLMIGMLTIVAASAQSITQFAAMRFFAGLGFGAVLTAAPTIAAEWMPKRLRQQVAAAVVIGIPIGGMGGAALGASLLPMMGWRAIFVVGGAMPLMLAACVVKALPESPRFLNLWPNRRKELRRLLAHSASVVSKRSAMSDAAPMIEGIPLTNPVSGIFAPDYRRCTVGLSLGFFANLAISYAFFSWTPVFLGTLGVSLKSSLAGLFYFNLFGTLGAICVSSVLRIVGSRGLLITLAGLGVLASVMLGVVISGLHAPINTTHGLYIALGGIGVATIGGQTSLFAIASYSYPTDRRASGLGFVGSTGRWGGLMSTVSGGLLLASEGGQWLFPNLIAVLFVTVIVGALVNNRHWHKYSLK